MRERVLIIDGEYLRKEMKSQELKIEELKSELFRILGEAGYPTSVYYYGADEVDIEEEINMRRLEVKKLELNISGYRYRYDNGRVVQKGVDSRIVLDSYKLSLNKDEVDKVYLLSGDGDMFPLLEDYEKERKEKMIVLSFEDSSAGILSEKGRVFNFKVDKVIKENKEEPKHTELKKNSEKTEINTILKEEKIVREAYEKLEKEWMSASQLGKLGSKNKKFKLKHPQKIFRKLEEKEYIEVMVEPNKENPDLLIKFMSLNQEVLLNESLDKEMALEEAKEDDITSQIEKLEVSEEEAVIKEAYEELGKEWMSSTEFGQLGGQNKKFKLNNIQKIFKELAKKDYIEVKKPKANKNPDLLIKFLSVNGEDILLKETKNLLKGGEKWLDTKLVGKIVRNKEYYFFVKCGNREEDLYLPKKTLDESLLSKLKRGSKITFHLEEDKDKGKKDMAIDVELV